jgi:hypothetical protein
MGRTRGPRWTEWDARCAGRAAVGAAVSLAVAWAVTAASDEGGLAWGERAGRALPFAPVCAAVGAWLALAPGRARGEDVALAALGRSPWERHAAAVAGGACVALLAALAMGVTSRVDVRGFYPRPGATAIAWRADGASFVSLDGRWRIDARGAPERLPAPARADSSDSSDAGELPGDDARDGLPRHARAAAALATAIAGLALPALLTGLVAAREGARAPRRRSVASAAGLSVASLLATLLAFQAAAAERAPALVAAAPPLFLLVAAATLYAAGPWRARRARFPR